MSSALKCLEASSTDDLYTEALLAYVCGLAGREEQQQARLQSLLQRGTSTGTSGPPHPTWDPQAGILGLPTHPELEAGDFPPTLSLQRGYSSGRGRTKLCPLSSSGLRLHQRR